MLIHDDFDHFHTWYVIDSVAHQVTGPKRELESLVVQEMVVYFSNGMLRDICSVDSL